MFLDFLNIKISFLVFGWVAGQDNSAQKSEKFAPKFPLNSKTSKNNDNINIYDLSKYTATQGFCVRSIADNGDKIVGQHKIILPGDSKKKSLAGDSKKLFGWKL